MDCHYLYVKYSEIYIRHSKIVLHENEFPRIDDFL